jgi:hypothetical protein
MSESLALSICRKMSIQVLAVSITVCTPQHPEHTRFITIQTYCHLASAKNVIHLYDQLVTMTWRAYYFAWRIQSDLSAKTTKVPLQFAIFPVDPNSWYLDGILQLPVLIEASSSLVLGFVPIMPPGRLDASIHKSVCKDNPPKRSPWAT